MSIDFSNIDGGDEEENHEPTLDESGLLPEQAQPRHLGEAFSTQAARGAAAIEAQHNRALQDARDSGRALIALPNGEFGYLDEDEEFIGTHQYLSGFHKSLFADAQKLLKDPKPGWMYVWAAKFSPRGDKANAQTLANIRAKRYVPIDTDDVAGDCDLPIEDHVIAGQHCAGIVDVLLMGVPPEAQKALYKWRTFEAKRRTNRWQSFEELQGKIAERSGGKAFAEYEVKH